MEDPLHCLIYYGITLYEPQGPPPIIYSTVYINQIQWNARKVPSNSCSPTIEENSFTGCAAIQAQFPPDTCKEEGEQAANS